MSVTTIIAMPDMIKGQRYGTSEAKVKNVRKPRVLRIAPTNWRIFRARNNLSESMSEAFFEGYRK